MSKKIKKKYHGVVVPMITPFTAEGELDEGSLRKVIEHLISGGVQGILSAGTNGEGPSQSWAMRRRLMEICVEQSAGRIQIYAGLGHCCFSETAQAGREYLELGVDALVSHLPFYFTLDGREQFQYFSLLAQAVAGPLMLYNIPGTTGMSIPLEIIQKLSDVPNIVGVKDSVRDLERLGQLFDLYKDDEDFSVLSGATILCAKALAMGSDGMIPSGGNIVPRLCADIYAAGCQGQQTRAEELQQRLTEINDIYLGERPVGKSVPLLKMAMTLKGLCEGHVLPPLCGVPQNQRDTLRKEMIELGLL